MYLVERPAVDIQAILSSLRMHEETTIQRQLRLHTHRNRLMQAPKES